MIAHEKFNLLCWIWIGIAIILVPILLKITQPYGKHTTHNWGPMISNKTGWILMELPALLVFGYFVVFYSDLQNKIVQVAGILWGIHYGHRSIIYPLTIKTKGKKMPVLIVLFAILFNLVNGFLNGYWLVTFVPQNTSSLMLDLRLLIGIVIFLIGFVINKYHDWLLIHLRKSTETEYKIPYGGLFKYVSCPNFFGEIISWLGFFIVTTNLPALSFLVWTLANLVTRSIDHHKWYTNKFPEYPRNRKAVFPGVL